ncbi:M1 family aminopeptidase [Caulobacter sp.]|uniref:M1 family aminopeptidase n=1 Tax=Caulobacter sp. TaxID=78 RepID=UPI0031CEC4A0
MPTLALLSLILAASNLPTPEAFEVERYAVTLRPDLATTAVSGTETIVVRATADGVTRLAFSPNALRIDAATADGGPVQVVSDAAGVVFTLPRPLRKGGKATLRFRIAGTPARGVTAAAGGLHASYFACDWMVCRQDTPGDKADLALDLYLPAGAQSLAVGQALAVTAAPDGLTRHRWRATRPYPAYLYGFAAGPFARQFHDTPAGRLTYLDASGGQADLSALFTDTPPMAAFFADKAGVALPDGRYAQLLTAGREAQETASFSLIGRDELDREQGDPSAAWVIAHELAHQWWGNLVTCASWREFWLNEGVTTFMTAAWKQHRFGEAAYRRELDLARERLARARQAGFDKPLAWDGRYPSLATRRAVQYSKGALFLAQLRETMGEGAFWAGLRAYTRRHAGGTVTSRDFQAAMQAASPQDLSPLFATWVYGDDAAQEKAALEPGSGAAEVEPNPKARPVG